MDTLTITTETENEVWFLNEIGALDKTWEQIDWLSYQGFDEFIEKHIPAEFTFKADIRRYASHESRHAYGDTYATEIHGEEIEVEVWHGGKWHLVPDDIHNL